MGVKEDVKRCIDLVESHPDEGFRIIVLLQRISYVRQPEVVEYLKKYFFMDKIEPAATTVRMTYAYRTMMALSEMLRDFPLVSRKKFKSEKEYVKYHREWIKKQKTWDIIR